MMTSLRKLFFFVILVLLKCIPLVAQEGRSGNAIAPFKMRITDGSVYTSKQLTAGYSTVLVYFDPGCEHCEQFLQQLFTSYKKPVKKQFVLITFTGMKEVLAFAQKLNLPAYPYVKTGSEGHTYVVQKYYGVHQFPFVALYNNKGNKVALYEGIQTPVPDIITAIKKL